GRGRRGFVRGCLGAWRREGKDSPGGRAARRSPEVRRVSRGGGDVLLASHLVSDDATVHRTAGVEAIENSAVPAVENEEVAVELSREQQVAGCCGDRREHRAPRSGAPAGRPGRGIYGWQ